MTTDAVTAGMTPYRPSPLPPPAPGADGSGAVGSSGSWAWGTPTCADDLAACLGLTRAGAPGARGSVPPEPPGGPDLLADRRFLAERQPGGWVSVAEEWCTPGAEASVVERYLTPEERVRYDRLRPAVKPTWLLGRVAAKDAVRWWLADRGRSLDPAEVAVANEPSGRPVIDPGGRSGPDWLRHLDLRVSIAHIAGAGVAIVAQGADVGIDVEEAAPRPRSFARVAFSADERAERAEATGPASARPTGAAHAAMDDVTWMAAAWCAKEAAGKAAGTGLRGRPTRFVTRLVGPDLFSVGERLVRCTRLDPYRYCSHAGHSLVVGWTLTPGRAVDLDDAAPVPEGAVPGGGSSW